MSLTFDYYKNVPPPVKKMDRIKILADFDDIEAKIKEVRSLIKLEFSNKLLLAAQYRINDANPIDYIYMVLIDSITKIDVKINLGGFKNRYILRHFNDISM